MSLLQHSCYNLTNFERFHFRHNICVIKVISISCWILKFTIKCNDLHMLFNAITFHDDFLFETTDNKFDRCHFNNTVCYNLTNFKYLIERPYIMRIEKSHCRVRQSSKVPICHCLRVTFSGY